MLFSINSNDYTERSSFPAEILFGKFAGIKSSSKEGEWTALDLVFTDVEGKRYEYNERFFEPAAKDFGSFSVSLEDSIKRFQERLGKFLSVLFPNGIELQAETFEDLISELTSLWEKKAMYDGPLELKFVFNKKFTNTTLPNYRTSTYIKRAEFDDNGELVSTLTYSDADKKFLLDSEDGDDNNSVIL